MRLQIIACKGGQHQPQWKVN